MNSVGPDCGELKKVYDDCFNRWFAEQFLKGKTEQDETCQIFFQNYQSCVKVGTNFTINHSNLFFF